MFPSTRTLPRAPNEQCQQIFNLLLDVNVAFGVGATLRVAGGWVRDQLLQVESHDIDIAIGTPPDQELITGQAFARKIADFQKLHNLEPSTISIVPPNPGRSKHIETAQMRLCGAAVEFCHLRTDDYTSGSRIPAVRPGTPREDARRRDFTVNALFFNLHSNLIEDWTGSLDSPGQALRDLEQKVLRCPLSPRQTFLDDPLRALRGVRFAGQLGFCLDDSVLSCFEGENGRELAAALEKMVSRERIGIETGKMLQGRDPLRSLGLLQKTRLLFTTLLSEHYYVECSRDGQCMVGGATKTLTSPNYVFHPLLPADLCGVLFDSVAGQPVAVAPRPELFDAVSAELRSNIGRLQEILFKLSPPIGELRMILSLFVIVPPFLRSTEPSLLSRLLADTPPADIEKLRLTAMLTTATKLPSRIARSVSKMTEAASAVDAAWNELRRGVMTGGTRGAVYLAMKTLRGEDPNLLRYVVSVVSARQGSVEWKADDDIVWRMMHSDDHLVRLVQANGVLLNGKELSVKLNVQGKSVGRALELQERFLVDNPDAPIEDLLAFVRDGLALDFFAT